MSNVKFLSNNLATASTTTRTASTADSFYPITNIIDHRTTKKWRSTASSGNIVFDFGSALDVDTFAIKGDKLNGFGFTGDVTLEFNSSDSWGAPAYSTTITPDTTHNIGYKTFATQTYRYARISVSGASYVEISNLFLGEYIQLADNNIDFGWSYVNSDQSSKKENPYGQVFSTVYPKRKEIRASFKYLNVTEFTTISDLYDLHGKTEPLWFIVDESETIVDAAERFINQFRFKSDLNFNNEAFALYNTSFSLEEVV